MLLTAGLRHDVFPWRHQSAVVNITINVQQHEKAWVYDKSVSIAQVIQCSKIKVSEPETSTQSFHM
jgi:hypothetical protein